MEQQGQQEPMMLSNDMPPDDSDDETEAIIGTSISTPTSISRKQAPPFASIHSGDKTPKAGSLTRAKGVPAAPGATTASDLGSIANSPSAQLLRGRWNSWRQSIQQNAEMAMQTEVGQRLAAKAQEASQTLFNTDLDTAIAKATGLPEPVPNMTPILANDSKNNGGSGVGAEKKAPDSDFVDMKEQDDDDNAVIAPKLTAELLQSHSFAAAAAEEDDDQTGGGGTTTDDNQTLTYTDDDDTRSSSFFTDSSAGLTYSRALAAAVAARAAANVVADSVATGFRGRYGTAADQTSNKSSTTTGERIISPIRSQTHMILHSRAATNMHAVLESLEESHEYVLLLGQGMLGVNLKQTYRKHHGVYVDYMVEKGAAYLSHVVYVGDAILKVGELDVSRGTILEIPKQIANARRPVILVCSTGQKPSADLKSVNYVDIAIAMMHRIRDDEMRRRTQGISNLPLQPTTPSSPNDGTEKADGKEETATPPPPPPPPPQPSSITTEEKVVEKEIDESEDKQKDEVKEEPKEPAAEGQTEEEKEEQKEPATEEENTEEVTEEPEEEPFRFKMLEEELEWVPPDHSMASSNPANVPLIAEEAKKVLFDLIPKRGIDDFSVSMMLQAAKNNKCFEKVLRYAFITCALDGRRLPFLSAHFSSELSLDSGSVVEGQDTLERVASIDEDSQKSTASTQLMLFLELTSFVELFDVTPVARRREIAKRIAYKFFLPNKVGSRTEKPMFNFAHIVGPAELNMLIAALANKKAPIRRNIFISFQDSIVQSLSRAPFLTFLTSTECGRMRGYLRGTAPYQTVSPGDILRIIFEDNEDEEDELRIAQIHLTFMVCFLLCQHEREMGGEYDDIMVEKGDRMIGGANGLCCAIAIKKSLPRLSGTVSLESMKAHLGRLWSIFLAPRGGTALEGLSHSNETVSSLALVRSLLQEASMGDSRQIKAALSEEKLRNALKTLSDDLVYDFTVNSYSKFREHKFHEWLCGEMSVETKPSNDRETTTTLQMPSMKLGSVQRLLRKIDLPSGLSSHKPVRKSLPSGSETNANMISKPSRDSAENATVAVVFGSEDGQDVTAASSPALAHYEIRRYAVCRLDIDSDTTEEEEKESSITIPPTLEGYAVVPPMRPSPFGSVVDSERKSLDGWQVSLVDFSIPSEQESSLYGVSLVFQKSQGALVEKTASEELPKMKVVFDATLAEAPETPKKTKTEGNDCDGATGDSEKAQEVEVVYDKDGVAIDVAPFASPIVFSPPEEEEGVPQEFTIRLEQENPTFSKRLTEEPWRERIAQHRSTVDHNTPVLVGVVLLSSKNVIMAMRATLTKLLSDFSRVYAKGEATLPLHESICSPVVDLFGNFSHENVEVEALKSILQPYLRFGSAEWIERPIGSQKVQFELTAGQCLMEALPPIPLAMLFVTLLLEQKVVFSSSRRSLLHSAINAIIQLLAPLEWTHLCVPLVPSALVKDLLQYPAPFILGIPSEDAGNLQYISDLPKEVTLVDLDVGRVILASRIVYDPEETLQPAEKEATAAALRTQLLYLSQSLGGIFGRELSPAWKIDTASSTGGGVISVTTPPPRITPFEKLKAASRAFVEELVAGAAACSYWIGERGGEATVLFDEDRFFQVKNLRSQGKLQILFDRPKIPPLSLTLDDFDLILECFLRGQGLSTYVSSQPKESMAFF